MIFSFSVITINSVLRIISSDIRVHSNSFNARNRELGLLYLPRILRLNSVEISVPDGNSVVSSFSIVLIKVSEPRNGATIFTAFWSFNLNLISHLAVA